MKYHIKSSEKHRGAQSWHFYGEIRVTAKEGIGSPQPFFTTCTVMEVLLAFKKPLIKNWLLRQGVS